MINIRKTVATKVVNKIVSSKYNKSNLIQSRGKCPEQE